MPFYSLDSASSLVRAKNSSVKTCFSKAYTLIKQLRQREPDADVRRYVNPQILDQICDETKNPRLTSAESTRSEEGDVQEDTVEYSHAMRRRQQMGEYNGVGEDSF